MYTKSTLMYVPSNILHMGSEFHTNYNSVHDHDWAKYIVLTNTQE